MIKKYGFEGDSRFPSYHFEKTRKERHVITRVLTFLSITFTRDYKMIFY